MAEQTRVYPPKFALLREGDLPTRIYRVVSGWASCSRTLPSGEPQIISLLLKGDVIGVTDMISGSYRHSIETRTAMALQSISQAQLLRLAREDNNVALWLTAYAARENLRITNWLTVLSHGTAVEKIAILLMNVCERMELGSRMVRVPLTQKEIGQHIGLTLPHVSRTLGTLRRLGAVQTRHGCIDIVDRDRLAQIAVNMTGLLDYRGGSFAQCA